ncbi:B-box zinc finger protein [Streptomyces goshikiensis]|uniref:hypothetical protein n=1 Tax=Streptomyces goshikiensis TaxID=1942 RepID=UPI0036B5C9C9
MTMTAILCDYCKPLMPPGREYRYALWGGTVHHPGQCREVATPWRTHEYDEPGPYAGPADHDRRQGFNPYFYAGLTTRDQVFEPEGQPLPTDTPGYKRLTENSVEAIVVIVRAEIPEAYTLDEGPYDGDRAWKTIYQVRPATPEEAEGLLLDEATDRRYDGPID